METRARVSRRSGNLQVDDANDGAGDEAFLFPDGAKRLHPSNPGRSRPDAARHAFRHQARVARDRESADRLPHAARMHVMKLDRSAWVHGGSVRIALIACQDCPCLSMAAMFVWLLCTRVRVGGVCEQGSQGRCPHGCRRPRGSPRRSRSAQISSHLPARVRQYCLHRILTWIDGRAVQPRGRRLR